MHLWPLPQEIKIGTRIYKVAFPYEFQVESDGRICHGVSYHHEQTILIGDKDAYGKKRHPNSIIQTFIHEILHCIDHFFSADLFYNDKEKNGEAKCDQLAEGLLMFFIDNGFIEIPQ